MPFRTRQIVVFSLGGSLIIPHDIDIGFLLNFREILKAEILTKGKNAVLVCGGGHTARLYIQALREANNIPLGMQDLLGRQSTMLNAYLVSALFQEYTGSCVCSSLEQIVTTVKTDQIAISGFISPGGPTDLDTVLVADFLGVHVVYNLTSIGGIYDSDPNQDVHAKLVAAIGHKDYIATLSKYNYLPGSHSPFDLRAALLAQRSKIEVRILDPRIPANLINALNNSDFVGTKLLCD